MIHSNTLKIKVVPQQWVSIGVLSQKQIGSVIQQSHGDRFSRCTQYGSLTKTMHILKCCLESITIISDDIYFLFFLYFMIYRHIVWKVVGMKVIKQLSRLEITFICQHNSVPPLYIWTIDDSKPSNIDLEIFTTGIHGSFSVVLDFFLKVIQVCSHSLFHLTKSLVINVLK